MNNQLSAQVPSTMGTRVRGGHTTVLLSGYADDRENPMPTGIYRAQLDLQTGQLTTPVHYISGPSASFVALHPNLPVLYALHEEAPGSLSVYDLSHTDPRLKTRVPTGGEHPCHILADHSTLIISHYGSGEVTAISLASDGSPKSEATPAPTPAGRGPYPQQSGPRAHFALPTTNPGHWWVADLGADLIRSIRTEEQPPQAQVAVRLPPGSGPRHLAQLPDSTVVAVGELDARIYLLQPTQTGLQIQSSQPAHRATHSGPAYPSHVQVSPDGKRVYATTRGPDVLSVFDYTPKQNNLPGVLTHRVDIALPGAWPRHFAVQTLAAEQHADAVLIALQFSHTLVSVRVPHEGTQTGIGPEVALPGAACVLPVAGGLP